MDVRFLFGNLVKMAVFVFLLFVVFPCFLQIAHECSYGVDSTVFVSTWIFFVLNKTQSYNALTSRTYRVFELLDLFQAFGIEIGHLHLMFAFSSSDRPSFICFVFTLVIVILIRFIANFFLLIIVMLHPHLHLVRHPHFLNLVRH